MSRVSKRELFLIEWPELVIESDGEGTYRAIGMIDGEQFEVRYDFGWDRSTDDEICEALAAMARSEYRKRNR